MANEPLVSEPARRGVVRQRLHPQSDHRINACRVPGRQVAGERRNNRKAERDKSESRGIERRDAEQHRFERSCARRGHDYAECDACDGEEHSLAHDQPEDLLPLRAECHSDADLLRALDNGIGQDSIDTNHGQKRRDRSKHAEHDGVETLASTRAGFEPFHRQDRVDADVGIHASDHLAHVWRQRRRVAGCAQRERQEPDSAFILPLR
ncbi:MAG TPA: hypothetical protein VFZ38_09795 [Vicinamibacterales bacterium]